MKTCHPKEKYMSKIGVIYIGIILVTGEPNFFLNLHFRNINVFFALWQCHISVDCNIVISNVWGVCKKLCYMVFAILHKTQMTPFYSMSYKYLLFADPHFINQSITGGDSPSFGRLWEVASCRPSPCLNEGVCDSSEGYSRCHCKQGYSGLFCQVHACTSNRQTNFGLFSDL